MKKLIAVTGIILIGCVCLGAAFAPQQTVETGAAASTDQVENEYIVKAENGKIAIYRTDSDSPLYTTDALVSTPPKADLETLPAGITVRDERELRQILQDYCS